MPEGPEVKLFTDNVRKHFVFKKIKEVKVLSGRYTKKPIENLHFLFNKTLTDVCCKGKFIWFHVEDTVVFNTLGMTGAWTKNKNTHTRILFEFDDGSELCFNDMRNFGTFQIKTKDDLAKKLKSIGPDMLSEPPDNFVEILRKHNNKNICVVLMNQKVISGVGNYIKAESLWYSRINPNAMIKDLTDNNLELLGKAIRFVMLKSYGSLGASIKDYYTFDEQEGSATTGFVVYGRKTDYNGNKVEKITTLDKRTTHYSPLRQTIQ